MRTKEQGGVDALFLIVPTLILATSLYSLFQFGMAQNYLTSSATLVGRQLSREPDAQDLSALTQSIISSEKIRISDFHVMRFPIGNRIFIQLVLIGDSIRIGGLIATPSARSLTVMDQW